jgi:hypothetical protein
MTFPRLALRMAALATTLLVAACGGGGPTAPPVVPTAPVETPLAIPTFDLGTFALPSFAIPSFTSDKDLEALLPDSIGGQVVIKQSMSGPQILNSGLGASGTIDDLLGEVGATIDDVSVAIGVASNSVVVIAYQIDGVRAERIFDGFLTAVPSGAGGEVSELTVAGRSVTRVVAPGETTYIYLADDVLFVIGGTLTPQLLEDAVQQLPAD